MKKRVFALLDSITKKYPKVQNWIVGISWGGDSRLLTYFLEEYVKKNPKINLIFANFDHWWRKQSLEEQKQLQKEFESKGFVFEKGKSSQKSKTENDMRKQRYDFFKKLGKKYAPAILFLGHNLTDRIETTLQNMLRGAHIDGIKNMSIIDFSQDFEGIARPLLEFDREQIRQYLQKHKIDFFEDFTNYDDSVSLRNWLRKNIILPLLQKANNPALFLKSWQVLYDFLDKQSQQRLLGLQKLQVCPIFEKTSKAWYKLEVDLTNFDVEKLKDILKRLEIYKDIQNSTLQELMRFFVCSKSGQKYFKWWNFVKWWDVVYLLQGEEKFWEKIEDVDNFFENKRVDIWKKTDKLKDDKYLGDWIKQQKIPPFLKNVILVKRDWEYVYPLKEKLWNCY